MKAGYLLKITTWENDADNYRTIEVDGLSEEHCRFYIEVAQLFKTCHPWRDELPGFGNADIGTAPEDNKWRTYISDTDIAEAIEKIASKYETIPEEFDKSKADQEWLKNNEKYFYSDLIHNIIGSWAEGEYWRVFEDFKVFYIPHEILDVTDKFKENNP